LLLNKKKLREKGNMIEKNNSKKSVNEERIVKRMVENYEKGEKGENSIKPKVVEDLWADESSENKNKITPISLIYPKVPLPHPGQSYNPSKHDITNLLTKVVELNKLPSIQEQISNQDLIQKHFSSDEEDSIIDEEEKNLKSLIIHQLMILIKEKQKKKKRRK